MSSSILVHVLLTGKGPLSPEDRGRVADIFVQHAGLTGACGVFGSVPVRPSLALGLGVAMREWFRINVLGRRLASPRAHVIVPPYSRAAFVNRGSACLADGEPGPWVAKELVAALARKPMPDVVVFGAFKWKGERGRVVYGALESPLRIEGQHVWDMIAFDSHRGPDARAISSSKLVRTLRDELGVSVTCRTCIT